MRMITGLSDLKRGDAQSDQEVTIKEINGWVQLYLSYPSYAAKMTPEEARLLGDLLIAAANRTETAKP